MPLSSPESFVYAEIFCWSVSAYLAMFYQQETNPLSKVFLSAEPRPSEGAIFEETARHVPPRCHQPIHARRLGQEICHRPKQKSARSHRVARYPTPHL